MVHIIELMGRIKLVILENDKEYVFSWDNIPGNDNGRLIEFLKKKFDIDWVETAKIEKIDGDRIIRLSLGNNFLSLRLNDEKTKVNLNIDDLRTDEFIARIENGQLNIYKDGKLKIVCAEGKPEIGEDTCPIWNMKRPSPDFPIKITRKCAIWNMERLIEDCGMFTKKRIFGSKTFVNYGTTEIMMTALRKRSIDAAVTVCDGAGTVITNNPELVQGIGAEMPGLLYTEPIKETIYKIEEKGGHVLDRKRARIDQVEGVKKAQELIDKLGIYKKGKFSTFLSPLKERLGIHERMKIAVSIVEPSDAEKLREMEKEYNIDLILMGVHHTGLEPYEKEALYKMLDLMPNCGKRTVSDKAKIKYRVGKEIEMFALTDKGKKLLQDREDAVKANKD